MSAWFNFAYAKAIGHVDGTSIRFISEYKRHDVRVTSLCAEGHVVLVAHSDVGQGGGISPESIAYPSVFLYKQHPASGRIYTEMFPLAPKPRSAPGLFDY
jgi:hypothetical protein